MIIIRNVIIISLLSLSFFSNAQVCDIISDSTRITHIDCFNGNTGSIDITLLEPNTGTNSYPKLYWWTGPNGFTANQTLSLSNLVAGNYILSIVALSDTSNINSGIFCSNLEGDTIGGAAIDTFRVYETLEILANFSLFNMCNQNDSADVITEIEGGTPPYSTLWNTGDTTSNITNLAQNNSYTLTITDKNNCINDQYLTVYSTFPVNSFMSSKGVICKDDNSGSARAFVNQGTSPYDFEWYNSEGDIIKTFYATYDESNIEGLFPGVYSVMITDQMGCMIRDTVIVDSDPSVCLTIYEAFSPNDDANHEFWEIKNIHLYPEALVLVYDRNGNQVYRRRNYKNEESEAFGGKDQNGKSLPSATYYYIIDLENGDKVFKGTVTIVR